ncbi:MAG: hypothetical protein FJ087_05340 [Deltaproteobacteria bacterium]|nr:hypothetical protein [Deltaproteobacteria bacterium]
MRVHVKALFGLGFASVLLAAAPAAAQFGGFKVNVNVPGGDEKVNKANDAFQKGFAALPESYGRDADEEGRKLAEAQKLLDSGRSQLTSETKLNSKFNDVDGKRQQLEATIAMHKLMLACSVARHDVRKTHVAGQEANDGQLKKLDDAVAAFAGGAKPEFKRQVEWWQTEAQNVRGNNKDLAASERDRVAREKKKLINRKLAEAEKLIDKYVKDARAIVVKGEAELPAKTIQDVAGEIGKVKAVFEPAGAYYEREIQDYKFYNAWFKPATADAANELAGLFGGTVVAAGETEGKALAVSFQAKADHCYWVAGRWKVYTGGEEARMDFSTKGNASAIQEWHFWRNMRWAKNGGVCVTADLPVTAGGELKFAGTSNALRYAVIAFPRAKFPMWIAADMSISTPDFCDSAAWKALWQNPIPGTLVWGEKEPYVVSSNDGLDSVWLTVRTLTGSESRIQKHGVRGKAPASRAVKTQFAFRRCHSESTDPEAKKLAACHDGIDKKYGPQYDKWGKEKEYAKTISQYQNAKQKLDQLGEQEEKERTSKCGAIEAKISKRCEETFNALVDEVTGKGPSSALDTPAYWDLLTQAYTND